MNPRAAGIPLVVTRLGRTDYAAAHRLQAELVAERARDAIPDQLLITEHDCVVTRGRRSAVDEGVPAGVAVLDVERGGQATWHGPGQVVLYPIRFLPPGERDLKLYLRALEQVVINALATLGLDATRVDGLTGVWIGGLKVCSIGIAVRRWVTWHGLALNVRNDPAGFGGFRPCGLAGAVMTRVVDHAPPPDSDPMLEEALRGAFCGHFGYEPAPF